MYKYYSKIFFSRNSPKSFNFSLVFPFLAIILSSMATIIIFSFMNSLEIKIIDKIIGVTGYSRIYMNVDSDEEFNNQYTDIKDFLHRNDKKVSLSIDRTGILFYNNKEQIVRVIGISDVSILNQKLGIELSKLNNFKNKILIGSDLSHYLGIEDSMSVEYELENNIVTIFAPIESKVLLKSSKFECISEKFEISSINAIDQISQNYVFISYEDAEKLFSNKGSYLSIDSLLNSEEIKYINDNFSGIIYQEWKDSYPLFFSAMSIEKFLYTSFGAILIFVASFNLYGLINLIIYRKKNQLSMLLYLGVELKKIRGIFINNIIMMGFLGSFVGALVSYFIIKFEFLESLTPILDEIKIPFLIIPCSIIFNVLTLYISTYFSMNRNIKNIQNLKSNAITS